MLIRSVDSGNSAAFAAAVNAVDQAAVAALEGVLNTPTALSWTLTGGGAHSISCLYGVPGGEYQTGGNMVDHSFTFQLLATDPTIS